MLKNSFLCSAIKSIFLINIYLVGSIATATEPLKWKNDLTPIANSDWDSRAAAHLLDRAGFGGTPEEVAKLASMEPKAAVSYLVNYKRIPNQLKAFIS